MACCGTKYQCVPGTGPVAVEPDGDGWYARPEGGAGVWYGSYAEALEECPEPPFEIECGGCGGPYSVASHATISFTDQDPGLGLDNSYELFGVGPCLGAPYCLSSAGDSVRIAFFCGAGGEMFGAIILDPSEYSFDAGGSYEAGWDVFEAQLTNTIPCGESFPTAGFAGRARIYRDGVGYLEADVYVTL